MQAVLDRVRSGEADPQCETCGGILKSDTISFGQALMPEVIERAMRAAGKADCLIAVGHEPAGVSDCRRGAERESGRGGRHHRERAVDGVRRSRRRALHAADQRDPAADVLCVEARTLSGRTRPRYPGALRCRVPVRGARRGAAASGPPSLRPQQSFRSARSVSSCRRRRAALPTRWRESSRRSSRDRSASRSLSTIGREARC